MEKLLKDLDKNLFTSELVSKIKDAFDNEVSIRVDAKVKEAVDAMSFFNDLVNDKKTAKLKESIAKASDDNKARVSKLKKNMCERMGVIEAQAIKNIENMFSLELDKLENVNKRNVRKLKEAEIEVIELQKTIEGMDNLLDTVNAELAETKRKAVKETRAYATSINELTDDLELANEELSDCKAELERYKRQNLNHSKHLAKIAELEIKLEEALKAKLIAESCVGMTLPQMDKFKELASKKDFKDERSFYKELKSLKESKSAEVKTEDSSLYSRFF